MGAATGKEENTTNQTADLREPGVVYKIRLNKASEIIGITDAVCDVWNRFCSDPNRVQTLYARIPVLLDYANRTGAVVKLSQRAITVRGIRIEWAAFEAQPTEGTVLQLESLGHAILGNTTHEEALLYDSWVREKKVIVSRATVSHSMPRMSIVSNINTTHTTQTVVYKTNGLTSNGINSSLPFWSVSRFVWSDCIADVLPDLGHIHGGDYTG